MGTAIPTTHPSSGGISGRVKRRDIQGLRALAVALVVVYHCAPQLLPGGYVGVDVFLVISGYLITAHLANEFYATGRVSLTRFYARRARRLLPAALLVLAVTVVASALLLPESSRAEVARQVVASAFYFENWVLAFNATDYSAASANSSPVQHYWSLSVEEQFYALWPLAILGAGALAARLSRSASVGLGALLSVVASVSLLASALVTAYDPNFAYFFTPIRLWEFAVGGLAWFLFSARTWSAPTANALSWIGLGLIAAATLSYDEGTPFPGLAAVLPVLGAALVLAGGETTGRVSTAALYRWRPVQYLGDISYSVYLWHWPLVVLLPWAFNSSFTAPLRVLVVVASLALGAVTKRFIEEPFLLRGQHGRRTATRALAGMLGVMILVAGPSAALGAAAQADADSALKRLDVLRQHLPQSFGATVGPEVDATDGELVPDPVVAGQDFLREDDAGATCQQGTEAFSQVQRCSFGSPSEDLKIALVGDSHASHWLPALASLAGDGEFALTTYLRSGCPLSYATTTRAADNDGACLQWVEAVVSELSESSFDAVIVSAWSGASYTGDVDPADGFISAWSAALPANARLVAIRDTPSPEAAGIKSVPACLEKNRTDVSVCSAERERALLRDPQVDAVERLPDAHLLDFTDVLCTEARCPAVIGNATVYFDGQHLTRTFTESAAPILRDELEAASILPTGSG